MALSTPVQAPIILPGGEQVELFAEASDAHVLVTERRLMVVTDEGFTLDIPFEQIRKVEFDLEDGRPATLVIIPASEADPPQLIRVETEHLDEIARLLAVVGARILSRRWTARSGNDSGQEPPPTIRPHIVPLEADDRPLTSTHWQTGLRWMTAQRWL